MKATPVQVVLAGGGYVSVWAYKSLARSLKSKIASKLVEIVVVCPDDDHFYHGWTAECLTGIINEKSRRSRLTEILPHAKIIKGHVESLDYKNQQIEVSTSEGKKCILSYDHLLFGTGSYDNITIPGLAQHGYQIKDPKSFIKTRKAIQNLIVQALEVEPAAAERLLSITVAGGGLTGIEMACNLKEWIDHAMRNHYSKVPIRATVHLINGNGAILESLRPGLSRLAAYAEKVIKDYEIKVYYKEHLVEVTSDSVRLSSGKYFPSSIVISTIGQRRSILPGTEALIRDQSQRLMTNEYQQINGLPNLWGGGDACHIKHYQTGQPCTSNALWAIKHGHYAGLNIARVIKGQALRPFTYKGLGQTASLGFAKGATELYGLQFVGWFAWILRWFFFQYFMPSRKTMFKNIKDWTYFFFYQKRIGM